MHEAPPLLAGEAVVLAAAERIALAADIAAVTAAQERAKANAILDGLRSERVLSLLVPADLGGQGLGIASAARLVAAVATASGSAGLICAMHLGQVAALVRHGEGDAFAAFLRRLADRQILVASGTSEVGVGGDILKNICRTTPEG